MADREKMIATVNKAGTTWIAAHNPRFANVTTDAFRRLLGARRGGKILPRKTYGDVAPANLPNDFDGRVAWPKCASIAEVRDQSACGSCWAFATTEAATDRWCVATKGNQRPHLSARDLLSCCAECGDGCDGGYPDAAWDWLTTDGCVTGGNYNNFTGCVSYPLQNCDHHTVGKYPQCSTMSFDTPACVSKCDAQASYPVSFKQDKKYFATAYSLSGESDMMQDIFTYGSIGVAFTVYEDFVNYKSGIYSYTSGSALGGHAVKVIGWGVEGGVKYWTVTNSWNEDWGEQGFFRIKRGTNECGIEGEASAGLPKV